MGWGPRGDSGSARGRVRATQPFYILSRYDRLIALLAVHPKLTAVPVHPTVVRLNRRRGNMSGINNLGRMSNRWERDFGGFTSQLKPSGACRVSFAALIVVAVLSCTGKPPSALAATGPATLKPKTEEAFAKYVRETDARNNAELQHGKDLLWIDSLPEAVRKRAYAVLANGETQMERRNTQLAGQEISCPGGMIHHWEGQIGRAHV